MSEDTATAHDLFWHGCANDMDPTTNDDGYCLICGVLTRPKVADDLESENNEHRP